MDNICKRDVIALRVNQGIKINVPDAVHELAATLNLKGCIRINIASPHVLFLREISIIIRKPLGKGPIFSKIITAAPGNLIDGMGVCRKS